MAFDQVPPAVKATIVQESKGGVVVDIEKLSQDGKTVFGADIVRNGKEQETLIAEDGKVIKRGTNRKDNDNDDKQGGSHDLRNEAAAHWAGHSYPDGTRKSLELGEPLRGTWRLEGNSSCIRRPDGTKETECNEIWISNERVECQRFGTTGVEGVLRDQS